MSLDSEADHHSDHECSTVDDEAYEPTYAEAFPPLPATSDTAYPLHDQAVSNKWIAAANKMAVRSSAITQVFSVPVEEQRLKEMSEQQFGERGRVQTRICLDIMARTGVAIEISLAKDRSLSVVITGKEESVKVARKLVLQQLQTQTSRSIKIPKDHHRFILGPKGKRLSELELLTATKISIPRQEDSSDLITVTGTRDGIEKVAHEIQLISDEQAKLAFVRLSIPKIYHPFICGPFNQTIKDIMERTNSRINVPPPSVAKDELTIAGEKEGVMIAECEIKHIYETRMRLSEVVAVEVKKSQHKYIIGTKGQNLHEILAETGVSVEVPPLDTPSDTVTLRGDANKLGMALTAVYTKANSVVMNEVPVDRWLHRFIIGPKGANIKQITQDFPKVHIEFNDDENKIVIEGPPEEVAVVEARIIEQKHELTSRMAFVELKIDSKYHRHIIGRNGANVAKIKKESGVSIRIPSDDSNDGVVRIEGSPEGVACAKQQLIEMVEKMDNEKTRDIMIDHRYHKTIIGAQGANIRGIREKFSSVVISFPDPNKQSDVVSLRGPKTDVDQCYKHLHQIAQNMAASGHETKVRISKEVHPKIIGKGGAQIRKIRDETDTRIDFPRENSDSDVITITGKKENVEKARNMIEAIEKETVNIVEVTVEIPHKWHVSMIGAKGHLIREISEECGGVHIRFPNENMQSDKVYLRGQKEEVEKARKRLLEAANDREEAGYTAEVRAKPEFHGFLIGRGGSNIRELRLQTNTRIVFPGVNDADQELIIIIGKKENVDSAMKELKARIDGLENKAEREIRIDPRHHAYFVARRGEILRQIGEDFGGVTVSFPRAGAKSDRVVIKGAQDCVDGAVSRINEIVSYLEAQVTLDCTVPRKHHGSIMGPKGHRIQEISKTHNVTIKIPDRSTEDKERNSAAGTVVNGNMMNGDIVGGEQMPSSDSDSLTLDAGVDGDTAVGGKVYKQDIITITGRRENCEAARQAMLALVPVVEEMRVLFDFHGQLIGQKGKEIRQIMDECEVTIAVPKPDERSDVIRIIGPQAKIDGARKMIEKKLHTLEDERRQRELRSFRLEVEVPARHHTRLIGRRGAVISKVRSDNDVQVVFPERVSDRPDIITVIGLEENARKARDEIRDKVRELEKMISEEVSIDPRVHSRLIGARGRAISKIMDEFKVDIRMPGRDATDPDLVIITGHEDDVLDCRQHILNLEEEYLQDVRETEKPTYDTAPTTTQSTSSSKGFIVRDAPWSQSYQHNADDFPNLGASGTSVPAPRPVWPVRKN